MPYRRNDSPVWWASYTDASGRRVRRSTGTEDRREAAALEAKWKADAFREAKWEEPQAEDQHQHMFEELMVSYLQATQKTKRSAERDIASTKHLRRYFGGKEINSIKQADCRRYAADRQAEGAVMGTIKRELGLLSSAINTANREWGWGLANPALGLRLKTPPGRLRWLTHREARQLIAAAEQEPRAVWLADFIRLALATGMRRGELLGLEWKRVDLDQGLIYLDAGAHHQKNGQHGTVPLNEGARAVLLNLASFRAQHCPLSPWVFAQKDGERIESLKTSFRTACRRAGIEDFHIHDLRHTCAAWLVQDGVPIAEIAGLLRHADIRTTMRYAHLSPDNVREAVGRLDGLFFRSSKSRSGHVVEIGIKKEAR